ncbi:MAG: hypothetical protein AAGF15_07490, partial [Pseudomonadota bacterium]
VQKVVEPLSGGEDPSDLGHSHAEDCREQQSEAHPVALPLPNVEDDFQRKFQTAEQNPMLARFWNALSSKTMDKIDKASRADIEKSILKLNANSNATVNIRLSFGLFFLTVLAGKERRNLKRRFAEAKAFPLLKWQNSPVLVVGYLALIYSFFAGLSWLLALLVENT